MLLWYRDLLDPYQKNEALLLEDNGQSVSIDEDLVVYGPIRFKEESNIRLYWNKNKINHNTYIFFLKLHSTYKLCAWCEFAISSQLERLCENHHKGSVPKIKTKAEKKWKNISKDFRQSLGKVKNHVGRRYFEYRYQMGG